MPTFLSTPQRITSTAGVWETKDLSTWVPAGASGVVLVFRGDPVNLQNLQMSARQVGSTDTETYIVRTNHRHVFYVGVNANRETQIYNQGVYSEVYLVGYFTSSEATFFTNFVTVTCTNPNTWETKNINGSTGSDPVLAVLGQNRVNGTTTGSQIGFRMTGVTSELRATSISASIFCPCDGSKQFDLYTGNVAHNFRIHGYIKTGLTARATPAAHTLTAGSGTWQTFGTTRGPSILYYGYDFNVSDIRGPRNPELNTVEPFTGTSWTDHGSTSWLIQKSGARLYEMATYIGSPFITLYETAYFDTAAAPDARYGRPESDVSKGAWVASTGSNLYAMVDEASPANDGDLMYTTSATSCQMYVTPITDPASGNGHVIRVRVKTDEAPKSLRITLYQGLSTQIAQFTEVVSSSSWTTIQLSLSDTEANSITDYSNLSVKLEAL